MIFLHVSLFVINFRRVGASPYLPRHCDIRGNYIDYVKKAGELPICHWQECKLYLIAPIRISPR